MKAKEWLLLAIMAFVAFHIVTSAWHEISSPGEFVNDPILTQWADDTAE